MKHSFLYEAVTIQILDLIETGIYPAGSRLPDERVLAKKFDVSRAVIRQAKIALEASGRIKVKVGSGTYVLADPKNLGLSELSKNLCPLELSEAQTVIEAESVALAAAMITDEIVEELEFYIAVMRDTRRRELTPYQAYEAFYKTIARATQNNVLIYIVENMWLLRNASARLQQVYKNLSDNNPRHYRQEQELIVKALKNSDPMQARKATRTHFTHMTLALLEEFEAEAVAAVRQETSQNRSRFLMSAHI